jgi:hypothetical protein
MRLTFTDDYFCENDWAYRMYRPQAKDIFLKKKETFSCECYKTEGKAFCDTKLMPVERLSNGAMKIGCSIIRPSQVKRIIKWIKGVK